jgi:hypothetical protein
MRIALFCFASSLLLPSIALADVYKWRDANGRLHYSDQQPINIENQKFKPYLPPADAPAVKTLGEKEMEFRKRQVEAAENTAKAEKKLAEEKERQKNCDEARGNLKALESGIRLVRHDAKGERVFIEDSERLALIEESKKAAATWCR